MPLPLQQNRACLKPRLVRLIAAPAVSRTAQSALHHTPHAMASYEKLTAPSQGTAIRFENGQPVVPSDPIIPFIRGDGTGVDIWPATQKVLDAAVAKAYGGERRIEWFKVYAGDEACDLYGTYQYLPEDTLEAIRTYGVAIKGPLTTPIGGGIHPLPERGSAPDLRSVLLRAPLPLLRRHPQPPQAPAGPRRDRVPREHRGHLYGDRVGSQRPRVP
jgi:hypothetical protein